MGANHVRTPKNFVLEERLERYADGFETHPEHYRGRWAQAATAIGAPAFERVHLDLGCGKGSYLAARAAAEPRTLFLGLDQEPICVAYAAQRIVEEGLENALVLPRGAQALPQLFAAGELADITVNFPTPCPKARHATRRLVHVDRLLSYRDLLAPGGTVTLRTDSQPLRDYALTQFSAAGYELAWVSDDVRAEHPEHPWTEYEQRTSAMGAHVFGICATVGPEPAAEQVERGRTAQQSLAAYLPEDLSTLAYVPLGMEDAVVNFRNRQAKGLTRTPQG